MDYVKKRLQSEKTGHDWYHVYRVWHLAKYLQKQEGGDLELIELAALLHSATEENFIKTEDEGFRALAMQGMLDVLEISGEKKDQIIQMANESRFRGADTLKPSSIESAILQDSNWLDGLGAVGIARVFTAGGYLGRPIHDPKQLPIDRASNEQFQRRKREGTSYNYFFEKSFKVAEMLNTETARKIAEKRIKFMKGYLAEFMNNWNGVDLL
jgi:uncharacterized protein